MVMMGGLLGGAAISGLEGAAIGSSADQLT
jgi:hypothetical protein